jgi:hypothetical protein
MIFLRIPSRKCMPRFKLPIRNDWELMTQNAVGFLLNKFNIPSSQIIKIICRFRNSSRHHAGGKFILINIIPQTFSQNIVLSPTISKQLIFSAGRLAFGASIDVICSKNKFSYTVVSFLQLPN